MRRHKREQRYTHPRILIICEGETEEQYFKGILQDADLKKQLSAIRVSVITGKDSSPLKLVKEAIKKRAAEKKEGNPFKHVWVIFDHDHHPNRKEAWEAAKKNQIQIGFSSIAFEQWFLLHFSKSAKAFATPNQLQKELLKFYPTYQKGQANDFAFLKNNLVKAFTNANWLRTIKLQENSLVYDQNPWTDVDILVEKLINGNF